MIELHQTVSAETALQPLDPRWITYERLGGAVGSAFASAALAVGTFIAVRVAELPALPLIASASAIAVLLFAHAWAWPPVAYRHASFRLGTRALEVRRGVLWRSVIDVPRSRMQHSDVSQGPLERMFGLATLSVFTAGTRHSMVRVQGLSRERAVEIRAHLTQTHGDDVV